MPDRGQDRERQERDRGRGCLLGLAAGDAVGTALEFAPRGSFRPITDMVGGGPFDLQPGEWTDDTSMALCLATSLVETGRFDPVDQMDRYCLWREEGYLSSTGECFDIGGTVSEALDKYRETGDPLAGPDDPRSAGNGSIMRLAPVPILYRRNMETAVRYAAESSRTTHGAGECLDACRLLARILVRAMAGHGKEEVVLAGAGGAYESGRIACIAQGGYREKPERDILSTGYVVDSLEAALWCFHRTEAFEAAVLAAANLGDDADTTAAVCGQVAGAFYGESGIPARWLDRLVMREEIGKLADRLLEMGTGGQERGS